MFLPKHPAVAALCAFTLLAATSIASAEVSSNMLPPTWPYGMAVEVFSAASLVQAHAEAAQAAEREHVTPFLYWHPERYRLRNVASPVNLSHHRWTVDTTEDYELVSRLFDQLMPIHPNFTQQDVLTLIRQHPDLIELNRHIRQKLATDSQNIHGFR